MSYKEESVTKIQELGTLEKNWDSYGAPPIDRRVMAIATDIVHLIKTKHIQIIPMSSGGIALSWGLENLVIEVESDAISISYDSEKYGALYSDGS